MKKIVRNIILRNAYTSGQFAVATGKLALAATPLSIVWKNLKGYKIETYTAGNYGAVALDFSAITPVSNGAHRLTIKNTNPGSLQREAVFIVYGDATATLAEIAAAFNAKVLAQNGPNSVFKWVSFAANVLTIGLEDPTYADITFETDIVGLTATTTAPVLPVGASDAEGVSGYVAGTQYDKYTFHEEGTYREGNNDVPVIFEDVVYVDDSLSVFTSEAADVLTVNVTTVAELKEYVEVATL